MKALDQKKLTLLLAAVLAVVMVLLSFGNYFLLDRSGRGQSLARWHGQVEDRAKLLVEPFAQAARRLEQARDDALARAQGQSAEDSALRYAQGLEARPDGTTRAKAEGFDAHVEAGVFLPVGLEPDGELKHRIVTMRDTLNLFGQSWLKEYPNLWFAGVEKWLVAFFPEHAWADKVEAAYDPTGESWYQQAAPERNAKLAPVWGGVKRDAGGKSLVAPLTLPVLVNDKAIGVIGEDVPLHRLIDTVGVADHEAGLVRLVIDGGGGILALTERMPEIVKSGAPLKPDKKMADIAAAIEAVRGHGENSGAILDGERKRAIVYARVGSHPWTLVTLVPNAQLTSGTTASALVFSGLSVFAVILVVVLVGIGIRQAFAVPLGRLAQTEAELKTVEQREKSAIQVSEDLAKQLDEARKKTKTLESEVTAARAEAEAARAEAESAKAAAAAAATAAAAGGMEEGGEPSLEMMAEAEAAGGGMGDLASQPGEELIAPLDVDATQA